MGAVGVGVEQGTPIPQCGALMLPLPLAHCRAGRPAGVLLALLQFTVLHSRAFVWL